ncbi:hypothetical protein BSL78_29538 [Apostichopus japonicus]|uniref:DNA-directed DNA polymerase n=1 Tax=Stichopus japonicus TaxID=307972 RepID=A0A2G8JD31_STIJA|nr:hypothetical protein BSL78_29538 [Apostichopus japonicus]
MDGLEKLSTTSLPSHDNFYNKLKGVNISSVEYQYCQQVWQDHNMTSFRDFLEWYNNKDVVPFLEALDKMFHFYKEKKIDMFKQGISVPGLTLRYLFKDIRKDFFCLFPESHKDLYFLFKNNIVGGPSIIFHRYQEKGRSRIRNGKKCEQVLGFDANALYLWAIMQDMPTGVVLRRREETGFRREFTHYLQKTAAGWLEWEGQTRGYDIKHRLNGFDYVEKWECDWLKEQKRNPEIKSFLKELYPYPTQDRFRMSEESILSHVKSGEVFGVVECDIEVPPSLRETFAEMPPIFKNTEISLQDIGEHMAQFIPKAVFCQFGDEVSEARREGDKDPAKSILADTMKLIGNSAYGKTVTNKEKHLDVVVCNDDKVFQTINNPFFRSLSPLGNSKYEADLHKRVIDLDLPIQIGFFVYQYAKLRMLQFYYDFMLKFVDPVDFEYCEMDTDSAYIAISGTSLEDVIKPEMRSFFEQEKHLWFPRSDTIEHKQYDKRTPGLFKLEWQGDGIVSLNSKCYYCFGSDKEKVSCKGVNGNSAILTKDKFLEVIQNKRSLQATNRGFRMKSGQMQTYVQEKTALSYLYVKRKVSNDGVSTTPLDL